MSAFINYLPIPIRMLEDVLEEVLQKLNISRSEVAALESFLSVLKLKDKATYEHSIRVGMLARLIGVYTELDGKALLYAGLLHDVGKAQTNPATLKKTSGWTQADTDEIRAHVMDGYRMLRGKFDFTAEIILWHHRFQPNSYPAEMPPPLHEYSEGTRAMIPILGRTLALADEYDALHRVNDKFALYESEMVGVRIKRLFLERNSDQKALIDKLYKDGVFSIFITDDDGMLV